MGLSILDGNKQPLVGFPRGNMKTNDGQSRFQRYRARPRRTTIQQTARGILLSFLSDMLPKASRVVKHALYMHLPFAVLSIASLSLLFIVIPRKKGFQRANRTSEEYVDELDREVDPPQLHEQNDRSISTWNADIVSEPDENRGRSAQTLAEEDPTVLEDVTEQIIHSLLGPGKRFEGAEYRTEDYLEPDVLHTQEGPGAEGKLFSRMQDAKNTDAYLGSSTPLINHYSPSPMGDLLFGELNDSAETILEAFLRKNTQSHSFLEAFTTYMTTSSGATADGITSIAPLSSAPSSSLARLAPIPNHVTVPDTSAHHSKSAGLLRQTTVYSEDNSADSTSQEDSTKTPNAAGLNVTWKEPSKQVITFSEADVTEGAWEKIETESAETSSATTLNVTRTEPSKQMPPSEADVTGDASEKRETDATETSRAEPSSTVSSLNQTACQFNCSTDPTNPERASLPSSLHTFFNMSQDALLLLTGTSSAMSSASEPVFAYPRPEGDSSVSLQPCTSTLTSRAAGEELSSEHDALSPEPETGTGRGYSTGHTANAIFDSQHGEQDTSETRREHADKQSLKTVDSTQGLVSSSGVVVIDGTEDTNTIDGYGGSYYYYDDDDHVHHNETEYFDAENDVREADLHTKLGTGSGDGSSSLSTQYQASDRAYTNILPYAKASSDPRMLSAGLDRVRITTNFESSERLNPLEVATSPYIEPSSRRTPMPGIGMSTSSQSTIESTSSTVLPPASLEGISYSPAVSPRILTSISTDSFTARNELSKDQITSRRSTNATTVSALPASQKIEVTGVTRRADLRLGSSISPSVRRPPYTTFNNPSEISPGEAKGHAVDGPRAMAISETGTKFATAVPIELTPRERDSDRDQDRRLKKPSLFCTLPSTYKGPYPVQMCDKIIIKDLLLYDQGNAEFSVRSYDVPLRLRSLQDDVKILGFLASHTAEAFRMQNPSREAFVESVERIFLRIKLDGLCFDVDSVTKPTLGAYRHILKDVRVKLYDKLLCAVLSYMARVKLSSRDLISLLRLFPTVIVHQGHHFISTMEASVPNPLLQNASARYSLTAAMTLSMEVRGRARRRTMCLPLSLRGMQYDLLLPKESRGVGSIARFVKTAVRADELCTRYKHWPRVYDDSTASWYVSEGNRWIGFDDSVSLRRKLPFLLQRFHPDCVYMDDVHLDDPSGQCPGGPFPQTATVLAVFNESLRQTKSDFI